MWKTKQMLHLLWLLFMQLNPSVYVRCNLANEGEGGSKAISKDVQETKAWGFMFSCMEEFMSSDDVEWINVHTN